MLKHFSLLCKYSLLTFKLKYYYYFFFKFNVWIEPISVKHYLCMCSITDAFLSMKSDLIIYCSFVLRVLNTWVERISAPCVTKRDYFSVVKAQRVFCNTFFKCPWINKLKVSRPFMTVTDVQIKNVKDKKLRIRLFQI